jgi:hypothetical protein
MAEFGNAKYFFGYVCTDKSCANDMASSSSEECLECKKKLTYVELWRDDDYLELYEMMA